MRVLVMRHQQKSKGGFAPEDEWQCPPGEHLLGLLGGLWAWWENCIAGHNPGKVAAESAESDSPLGGKSPTNSSVFKADSERGSGELPPSAL